MIIIKIFFNLPIEKLPECSFFQFFCSFSEVVALPAQDMLHRNFDVRQQRNNFLKLHCDCEKKLFL